MGWDLVTVGAGAILGFFQLGGTRGATIITEGPFLCCVFTVGAILVQWTHCHVQETNFKWFELRDMVRYPAGSSHQGMGTWSQGRRQNKPIGGAFNFHRGAHFF